MLSRLDTVCQYGILMDRVIATYGTSFEQKITFIMMIMMMMMKMKSILATKRTTTATIIILINKETVSNDHVIEPSVIEL